MGRPLEEPLLAEPNVTTHLGVRDSGHLGGHLLDGHRRAELIGLRFWDVDHARGTVLVRQGTGARDRHVSIVSVQAIP